METIYRAMAHTHKFRRISDPAAYRRNQPSKNSLSGAHRNIHHHHDIGNDFYQIWLDTEMVYACAYFPDPAASLEDAQIAKMDLVCRKLRLQPGQSPSVSGDTFLWRISTSWATDATSLPARVKIFPLLNPRAWEALGLSIT